MLLSPAAVPMKLTAKTPPKTQNDCNGCMTLHVWKSSFILYLVQAVRSSSSGISLRYLITRAANVLVGGCSSRWCTVWTDLQEILVEVPTCLRLNMGLTLYQQSKYRTSATTARQATSGHNSAHNKHTSQNKYQQQQQQQSVLNRDSKKTTCCSEKRLCLLASREAMPKQCLAATQTSGDASTTVTRELGRALWRKAGNVQPPPPKTQMCRLHLSCSPSGLWPWIKLCRAMLIPRPSRCVAVSPWRGGGLEWSGSPFASKNTQLWQYVRRWLKCKERSEGFLSSPSTLSFLFCVARMASPSKMTVPTPRPTALHEWVTNKNPRPLIPDP